MVWCGSVQPGGIADLAVDPARDVGVALGGGVHGIEVEAIVSDLLGALEGRKVDVGGPGVAGEVAQT
jgi:hypothetical protein